MRKALKRKRVNISEAVNSLSGESEAVSRQTYSVPAIAGSNVSLCCTNIRMPVKRMNLVVTSGS